MSVVWKYAVPHRTIGTPFTLTLPKNARETHFAEQGAGLFLWAAVDPEAEPEDRRYVLVFTGMPIPDDGAVAYRVGTALLQGGAIVVHLFELEADEPSPSQGGTT